MAEVCLYDRAFEVVDHNSNLYDRSENAIAAYMERRWPEGFKLTRASTGSDNVTTLEVSSMGEDGINDNDAFIADLREVLRSLAKGSQLTRDGKWC